MGLASREIKRLSPRAPPTIEPLKLWPMTRVCKVSWVSTLKELSMVVRAMKNSKDCARLTCTLLVSSCSTLNLGWCLILKTTRWEAMTYKNCLKKIEPNFGKYIKNFRIKLLKLVMLLKVSLRVFVPKIRQIDPPLNRSKRVNGTEAWSIALRTWKKFLNVPKRI